MSLLKRIPCLKLIVKNKFSHRPKKKTDKSKKETKDVEPADIECIMNGESSAYEQPEDDNDKGDEYTWKDVVNFLDFLFFTLFAILLFCSIVISLSVASSKGKVFSEEFDSANSGRYYRLDSTVSADGGSSFPGNQRPNHSLPGYPNGGGMTPPPGWMTPPPGWNNWPWPPWNWEDDNYSYYY